jgi:hypothetical protein
MVKRRRELEDFKNKLVIITTPINQLEEQKEVSKRNCFVGRPNVTTKTSNWQEEKIQATIISA